MDTSFAGFTFGADELAINGSFSAQKHPRISKCSPFYRMNKPQTEQKPRLRLHSPNKENELMQIRKPVRVTTSPHSQYQMSYKEIGAHLIQLFKTQARLYEQLLLADNVNINIYNLYYLFYQISYSNFHCQYQESTSKSLTKA